MKVNSVYVYSPFLVFSSFVTYLDNKLHVGKLQAPEKKPGDRMEVSKSIYNENGIQLILKISIKLVKDPVAVRVGMTVIELQTFNVQVVTSFIQAGGLEFLYKVMNEHPRDDYLSVAMPKFLNKVLSLGAAAAISEIRDEAVNLQLCVKCQETLARSKNASATIGMKKLPTTASRVSRVLMFMENYLKTKIVQCSGLDALIFYSRNADCHMSIRETKTIEIVCKSLAEYKDDPDVVWRACLALTQFALIGEENSFDIVQYNVHDLVAESFHLPEFMEEPRVQQQILWVFNSLLQGFKASRRIHQSEICMKLFNFLLQKREDDIKATAYSTANKFVPYHLVTPVRIREFVRETKGEVLVEAEPRKKKKKRKKRYKEDNIPRFGTTHEDFKKGTKGLIESPSSSPSNSRPNSRH